MYCCHTNRLTNKKQHIVRRQPLPRVINLCNRDRGLFDLHLPSSDATARETMKLFSWNSIMFSISSIAVAFTLCGGVYHPVIIY